MTETPDAIEMLGEAVEDARSGFMEKLFRPMRAETVNRPLMGVKLTKDQRGARYRLMAQGGPELASEDDFLRDRYPVPPGQVSRALVEYLVAGEKEFGGEGAE